MNIRTASPPGNIFTGAGAPHRDQVESLVKRKALMGLARSRAGDLSMIGRNRVEGSIADGATVAAPTDGSAPECPAPLLARRIGIAMMQILPPELILGMAGFALGAAALLLTQESPARTAPPHGETNLVAIAAAHTSLPSAAIALDPWGRKTS